MFDNIAQTNYDFHKITTQI